MATPLNQSLDKSCAKTLESLREEAARSGAQGSSSRRQAPTSIGLHDAGYGPARKGGCECDDLQWSPQEAALPSETVIAIISKEPHESLDPGCDPPS